MLHFGPIFLVQDAPTLHILHPPNLRIERRIARPRLPRLGAPRTEQNLNLLEGLARRLRVGEIGLHGGPKAQDAEDEERFPGNIAKGRRDEEAEGEVEEPVGDGRERHTRGARFEGPDFRGVDPGDGGEGQGVDDYEEVGEGYDDVACRARDGDFDVEIAFDAQGNVGPVGAQNSADDKLADSHTYGAVDEEGATAGVVNEEEGHAGEDDEEGVLHPRRDEVDVARQPGHFKHVDHVVGHDICATELLPGLHGHACYRAAPHTILDELAPAFSGLALRG